MPNHVKRKFFRNKSIIEVEDEFIDQEALWELIDLGTRLHLVDDDIFIIIDYEKNKDNFKLVENGPVY